MGSCSLLLHIGAASLLERQFGTISCSDVLRVLKFQLVSEFKRKSGLNFPPATSETFGTFLYMTPKDNNDVSLQEKSPKCFSGLGPHLLTARG